MTQFIERQIDSPNGNDAVDDPIIDEQNDRPQRGLCRDQMPLRAKFSLSHPLAAYERLGLLRTTAPKGKLATAVGAIVANVALAPPGSSLFYSRNKNHYSGWGPSRPSFYTYALMMQAVELLIEEDLIVHHRASAMSKLRSSFRPTDKLSEAVTHIGVRDIACLRGQEIQLRDRKKKSVAYPVSDWVLSAREEVTAYNRFMSEQSITVEHNEVVVDENGFLVIRGRRIFPSEYTYRVFTETFGFGGRWYGPYWQGLSESVRKTGLLINGSVAIEEDFQACHLRILCHLAGVPSPQGDPYDRTKYPRQDFKLAFNIMLNARTKKQALGAITHKLTEQGVDPSFAKQYCQSLVDEVRATFSGFERFWSTGVGLRLQNIDSNICARVLGRLRDAGVPALSIHDSFVVIEDRRQMLLEVMEEAFVSELRKLS